MRKYFVGDRFHKVIGEFDTMREAVKFAIKHLENFYNAEKEYPVAQRIIKEDIDNFQNVLTAIGTKFAPKPDKLITGRYASIVSMNADSVHDANKLYI